METLNIALISSTALKVLPSADMKYGGLERIVRWIAEELVFAGHSVTLIAPHGSRSPDKLIETVPAAPDASEQLAYNVYKPNLKDFDIIHDHTWQKWSYIYKQENPDIKIISTLHGMCPYHSPPPVEHPNFVGISKNHSEEISATLGIPVKHVYNGIDMMEMKYTTDKTNRLIFLPRIYKLKGPHEAIELSRRLRLPIDVIGDDILVESQQYVTQIIQQCASLNGLATYHGSLPRPEVTELLSKAKCLVQPLLKPWSEPFNLSAIEAQACGTPVIITNNGSSKEVVQNNKTGYVVDHVADMQDAISKLDSIKPEACKKFAEQFNKKAMTENYLKLYKEVLNDKEW